MSPPVVSVGLPVYNGERYLRQALDSLLAQDFADFELIIADNASTDGSPQICSEYAKRDSRVRYFRNSENIGASGNHCRVVDLAQGRYFKWAAHDDECSPRLIGECVARLENAPPSVVLVYSEAELIDEHGQTKGYYTTSIECRDPRPWRRLGQVMASVHLGTPVYGVARTDALRKTRLIDAFLSSDFVLLGELALLGEIWEIPEPLLRKRMHPARSVEAHSTREAMTVWFDPRGGRRGMALSGRDRADLELLRSIWRFPLGPVQKLRCAHALITNSRNQRNRFIRWKARLGGLFFLKASASIRG
jgi:glycosyltransferase involved in cell wall biosynthesis